MTQPSEVTRIIEAIEADRESKHTFLSPDLISYAEVIALISAMEFPEPSKDENLRELIQRVMEVDPTKSPQLGQLQCEIENYFAAPVPAEGTPDAYEYVSMIDFAEHMERRHFVKHDVAWKLDRDELHELHLTFHRAPVPVTQELEWRRHPDFTIGAWDSGKWRAWSHGALDFADRHFAKAGGDENAAKALASRVQVILDGSPQPLGTLLTAHGIDAEIDKIMELRYNGPLIALRQLRDALLARQEKP